MSHIINAYTFNNPALWGDQCLSAHRDHRACRVFKSLTQWPSVQEHFDIFIAVICPLWTEIPELC